MTVRRVSSGSPWEPVVGYSRAVAAGETIYVSGCTGIGGDAYAQTVEACGAVRSALERLGARMDQVVRTRLYVTDITQWREVGRAHAEAFGEALPATSMVQVAALIDPRMLVEVEAVAWTGAAGGLT